MSEVVSAQAPRARAPVLVWLVLAMGVFLVLVAALGVLAFVGIERSQREALRAEQSLTQLENARAVEAAFNLYLLGELRRRVQAEPLAAESQAAGRLRGALLQYRRTIGEEIATAQTDEERADERGEMVRASALGSIFETVETEALLDRSQGAQQGNEAERARRFLAEIAAGRDEVFRAVLFEVLSDERAEAAAAFERIGTLRQRLVSLASVIALSLAIAAGVLAWVFHRKLMRPIRQLTQAAEALPVAGPAERVPEDLPREFEILARRFNQMAERIATEQNRLQGEVAARTADLSAANAALTRVDNSRRAFFADISHELRTPATVLLGEAQIALRAPGSEREALGRIVETCLFLRRRLDDLMRLARSEDGRLQLSLEDMDLADAVAEAAGAARAYAKMNGVALSLDRGPPAPIRGDPGAVRQAALALIDNAVKFSPDGGTVAVRTTAAGFSVSDSGPGFSSTDTDALFARYAQEGRGESRGGSGLGLAIVKWIADQHGARLAAQNRAEGGAMVSMEWTG